MPTTTVKGLRFFFVDEGHGMPVVLLHGFPDTSFLWGTKSPLSSAPAFASLCPTFVDAASPTSPSV